ncbi:MAG: sigma-54-dependent Fis family transcriptional regulator [Acidobacteria bacterium]|nr:sigma-54-dependent Fis family transcriptional regulator [Acidobacteriota bacterium]MBI3661911.1 sigma-54-dependent Fis family transcriptional regulator [Acidobacteriota bacterium]
MTTKERILVVDDEPSIRKYLQTLLEVDGFEVNTVSSGGEALELLGNGDRPDFVILDVLMPAMDGLETLRRMMQIDRGLNVVMLSCSNEVTTVVEAIRIGAHDYLTKPFEKSELDAAMLKCRQKRELRRENDALRDYCDHLTEDLSFLAASPQMVKIRQQILQIAPVDVPVFVAGESGVGKEVVARMIHMRSPRVHQPFIKVNCAALPSELLESELFGYEQGAFTGALRAKPGKFEMANKGTIFLDEIAEMSPQLQAKMLHVLQDHQFSRLGGRQLVQCDVRVLAATNVNVREAIQSGRFREDLYYRLNVFSINVPPLRERTREIPLLFRHFLEKYSEKFQKQAMEPSGSLIEAAMNYPWPGNLRELENFVKRYIILQDDEGSFRELLEMAATRQRTSPREEGVPQKEQGLKALVRGLKDEAEMEAIADALEKTNWSRKEAARMLGISYKALLYKMRQFKLDAGRAPRSAPATSAPRTT